MSNGIVNQEECNHLTLKKSKSGSVIFYRCVTCDTYFYVPDILQINVSCPKKAE
jgi:hypothetical protein